MRSRSAWGVEGVESETTELDHLGIVDEQVVPDVGEHRGVSGGDGHLVSGVAHLGHGADVVVVPVRLEDPSDAEAARHLEQSFVLVRGVDQHRLP